MQTDAAACGAVRWLIAAALFVAGCHRESLEIPLSASPRAQVVIAIRDARGALVRTLSTTATERSVKWDALDDSGRRVEPGAYSATVIAHRGFATRPSGEIGWKGFSSSRAGLAPATPIAVATAQDRVFLAWSDGRIAACDLEGNPIWTTTLPRLASCAAMAIDGDQLFVLARSRPPWLAQDDLVRLRISDGKIDAWPRGERLPIPALWPPNAEDQPTHAGALTAAAGHVYLAFPELHFLAVLRGDTGEYLQTIIGPAPTAIGVVATRTESPTEPGTIIDADFAVIALGAGALSTALFAHDPVWVIGSDAQRLDGEERISALTLLGDAAPRFPRSIFVGIAPPLDQVQRRDILDPRGYLWIAGNAGGRPETGAWQPESLRPVKSLALDSRGRLWVAEADAVPSRFSVWSTEGNQGRVVGEFFGPLEEGRAALLPGRPEIVVAGGCEWQIDPAGATRCLGVITREGMTGATFAADANGKMRLQTLRRDGTPETFVRRGDGDYEPAADDAKTPPPASRVLVSEKSGVLAIEAIDGIGWRISTADGIALGTAEIPAEWKANAALSAVARSADGRVFGAVSGACVRRLEILGLDAIEVSSPRTLRVSAAGK